MPKEHIDAKTDTASSAESDADVKQDSQTSGETNETQTQSGDDKAPETLEEAISEVLDKSTSDKTAKEETSESGVQDLNKTKEEEKEKSEKETEADLDKKTETDEEKKEAEKQEADQKGPVPYERFQEVIHQKNDFEAKTKEMEPIVKAHRSVVEYLDRFGVTPEQYQEGVKILGLINSDPEEALKMLNPLVDRLKGISGDAVAQDLQNEVDEGLITLERAKELTKLRNRGSFDKERTERERRQQAALQEQTFRSSVSTEIQRWQETKMAQDPDLVPKASADAPDGKYEVLVDRATRYMQQTQFRSAKDAIDVLEKAYAEVNKLFSRFTPTKTSTRKTMSSSKSSTSASREPETLAEAIQMEAQRLGVA